MALTKETDENFTDQISVPVMCKSKEHKIPTDIQLKHGLDYLVNTSNDKVDKSKGANCYSDAYVDA